MISKSPLFITLILRKTHFKRYRHKPRSGSSHSSMQTKPSASMKPSLFWQIVRKASLNSWICDWSNVANTLDVVHRGPFLVVLAFALLLDTVAVKSLLNHENLSTSGTPSLPWLPLPTPFHSQRRLTTYFKNFLIYKEKCPFHQPKKKTKAKCRRHFFRYFAHKVFLLPLNFRM